MTNDQLRARELIALYEGAGSVTCEMRGKEVLIETDTGRWYSVSADGGRIHRDDEWQTDLTELEERIYSPGLFKSDPDRPCPESSPPPIRLATDEDRERAADLEASGRAQREMDAYWRAVER